MNRRDFLKAAAVVPMVAAVPALAVAEDLTEAALIRVIGEIQNDAVFFNNRVWWVSTSSHTTGTVWSSEHWHTNVADAIDASKPGDTILIAPEHAE